MRRTSEYQRFVDRQRYIITRREQSGATYTVAAAEFDSAYGVPQRVEWWTR